LDQVIDFTKNFVDICHHGKEKESLFPAPGKGGMLREESGSYSKDAPWASGDKGDGRGRQNGATRKKYLQSGNTDALVAADIKSYIDHVALHLADKENYRLFVMADMVLQGRGEEIINSDLARSKGLELKELGRTRAHYEKLVGNVESDLPS
jgi:hemerythrin-like domain-containing protein